MNASDPQARRNWLAHAVEGGLFMGAMACVNAQTLLPSVVNGLGGPQWLVAQMPAMMMLGFQLPPIFLAHRIAGLSRFQPLLLWTGIPQRLPFLIAAILLLTVDSPAVVIAAVAAAPLLSGLFGGISATAWQQLLVRTVPPERRASLFAVRFAISSLLGIPAGWLIARTLAAHPGQDGYGLLHLYAFAGLMASYAVFAMIREPAEPAAREPETGLLANLRSLPRVVAEDAALRRYLATAALGGLAAAVVPYLGIHAVHAAQRSESFLGQLIAWQMGGAVAGGLLAGWAGDRFGARPVCLASRLGWLAVCGLAPCAGAAWTWCALFALFGATMTSGAIGMHALSLAILPEHGRANRLAVMMSAQMPIALLAGFGGGAVWSAWGHAAFAGLALACATLGALAIVPLRGIREPHRAPPASGLVQP